MNATLALVGRLLFGLNLALGLGGLAFAVPVPAYAATFLPGRSVVFDSSFDLGPGQVVGGDVVVFGGPATVAGTVDGNLVDFGGSVLVRGQVARNLIVFGTSTLVDGDIGGGIEAYGTQLILGPNADVRGRVSLTGGSLVRYPGSRIGGQMVTSPAGGDFGPLGLLAGGIYVMPGHFARTFSVGPPMGPWGLASFGSVTTAIYVILLAGLAQLLFARNLEGVESVLEARPLHSLGWGCLGLIAVATVILSLAFTVVLLPLAMLLVMAAVVATIGGWAAVFSAVGRRAAKGAAWSGGRWLGFTVGAAMVLILSAIPAINLLEWLLGGSAAFGAVLWSRFGTHRPIFSRAPDLPGPPLDPLGPPANTGQSA